MWRNLQRKQSTCTKMYFFPRSLLANKNSSNSFTFQTWRWRLAFNQWQKIHNDNLPALDSPRCIANQFRPPSRRGLPQPGRWRFPCTGPRRGRPGRTRGRLSPKPSSAWTASPWRCGKRSLLPQTGCSGGCRSGSLKEFEFFFAVSRIVLKLTTERQSYCTTSGEKR